MACLKHWVNMITLHAPDAPFAFVGTHGDKANTPSEHDNISNILKNEFPSYQLREATMNGKLLFFPVDNISPGSESRPVFDELRKAIRGKILKKEYVHELVPIRWLCWLEAFGRKSSHLPLKEVSAAASVRFHITTEKERDQMLELFHELGLLLHYPDHGLRNVVIFDPQWLINMLTVVIRDFALHARDEDDAIKSQYSDEWTLLTSRGQLSASMRSVLWPAERYSNEEREFCFELMQKQNLAVPLRFSGAQSDWETVFLIPSIIPAGINVDDDVQRALSNDPFERTEFCMMFSLEKHGQDKSILSQQQISKIAILPDSLFAFLLCQLLQEHQYTSAQPESCMYNRNRALVVLGEAVTTLDVLSNLGVIKVTAPAKLALRTARRLKFMYEQRPLFPQLRCRLLLPMDDNKFVDLEKAALGKKITVGVTTIDPIERFPQFLENHSPPSTYDCMISYRRGVNSNFARWLCDVLSNDILHDKPLTVFLDQLSLRTGEEKQTAIHRAISHSKVLVPVISRQTIEAMRIKHDPDQDATIELLLLEWMVMVAVLDFQPQGSVAICPMVVGDSWSDDRNDFSAKSLDDLKRVARSLPDQVDAQLYEQLCEAISQLPTKSLPRKYSTKAIVCRLLDFEYVDCIQNSFSMQEWNWDAYHKYANALRDVVDRVNNIGSVEARVSDGKSE